MPSYKTTTTTYTQGNITWLRTDKGLRTCETVTLNVAAFTSGTHYPNGFIPSGMTIGKVTAGGYGPYDNAASDGRQTMVGHLLNDEPVHTGATHIVATLLWEGVIQESKLPSNSGIDSAGKTDMAASIRYK